MKSKDWIDRNKKDFFVQKAVKEGYLSRAAYKLIEIENKFKILTSSRIILELGSSPGSWSQVICKLNKKAQVHAFDISDMHFKHPRIKFIKKNFLEFDFKSLNYKYDLILSDIAPNTLGHQSTDHLRIISLIEEIICIVEKKIQINGNFIFKIWTGSEDKKIISKLKKKFEKITYFKPLSSRVKSSEIYIISQKFIAQ